MRSYIFVSALALGALAIPTPDPVTYSSLAGRSDAELDALFSFFSSLFQAPQLGAQPPPPPLTDASAKLVNDAAHSFLPQLPGQQRGPCPGLNTLASHGYLPRSGVATPGQIVQAAQEGFNMGNDLAILITYGAMVVDGNPITNLMSIGGKSPLTGADPPNPAIVGGLSTHGTFEGDASLTRGDEFFGDNHSFNETLFQQFIAVSNEFGGGKFNISAAAQLRGQRINESVATNPEFFLNFPRFITAFAEATFASNFFVDGRVQDGALDLDVARSFFQDMRMPDGFVRRNGSFGLTEIGPDIDFIFAAHPFQPGQNQGVGNFVVDQEALAELGNQGCALANGFAKLTVKQYPSPTGALRDALNQNLDNMFSVVLNCTKFNFP